MSTIVIKDLPESVDLDRQAMRTITGGARLGSGQSAFGRRTFGRTVIEDTISLFNYPHFARKTITGDRTGLGTNKTK